MRRPSDPSRLRLEAPPGSTLGRAIEAAQTRGPTAEQLRVLERSVFASIEAGAPASTLASEGAQPKAVPWLPAGTIKLVAVLALGSAGVIGGLRLVHRAPLSVAAPAPLEPEGARALSSVPLRPVVVPAPVIEPGSVTAPVPRVPRLAPRRPSEMARTGQTATAPRDDELALLERAERSLATAPAVSLSLADAHERLFPSGSMEEEREVIAVSALARLGRQREARARADLFAREHSGSAYTMRIQHALKQDSQVNK
jgi:hypothetical protein